MRRARPLSPKPSTRSSTARTPPARWTTSRSCAARSRSSSADARSCCARATRSSSSLASRTTGKTGRVPVPSWSASCSVPSRAAALGAIAPRRLSVPGDLASGPTRIGQCPSQRRLTCPAGWRGSPGRAAPTASVSTPPRSKERVSELRSLGFDAAGITGALLDGGVASGLVSAALEQWGRLDIVVNNAGMISAADPVFESGTVESMDLVTWQAALARNLTSAFLVTKAAVPAMTSRGWGRIIMVASLTGPVMAIRADVGYATAKAGMVGLTRAAAVDTARHGITVNAVAPGWIATGSQTPEERGQGQATPAGRSGSPEEVAAAIAWLASPGASYITGQYLVVDGGNSIAEQRATPA